MTMCMSTRVFYDRNRNGNSFMIIENTLTLVYNIPECTHIHELDSRQRHCKNAIEILVNGVIVNGAQCFASEI